MTKYSSQLFQQNNLHFLTALTWTAEKLNFTPKDTVSVTLGLPMALEPTESPVRDQTGDKGLSP